MDDVSIRLAGASDAEAVARVHAAAWRAAFTFLPPPFLQAMTARAVLGKWRDDLASPSAPVFVAIDDGGIVGFLQVRAAGGEGEVMALYVDPSRWGRSVGSTLLAFGETWLVAHGVETALLWTARDSTQSRGFYEHRGWVASGGEQTQSLGPADVALHEVQYRKSLA